MFSGKSNIANLRVESDDDAVAIALQALVWTLQDDSRAQRLLALTGLTAGDLRAGAGDPAILAALLAFLATYEPDLVACAAAIGEAPERLMAAKDRLES